MAEREGDQADTLPSQLYGHTGTTPKKVKVNADGSIVTQSLGCLVPVEFDYVLLDPPLKPTTVTYKLGGPTGTVVATLTLTYDGVYLQSVART